MLIDGSSTHNFINQNVATKFGLLMLNSKKLQAMVANKEKIDCAGLCK